MQIPAKYKFLVPSIVCKNYPQSSNVSHASFGQLLFLFLINQTKPYTPFATVACFDTYDFVEFILHANLSHILQALQCLLHEGFWYEKF